jgi:6-phosphogluconate dehydrogenase
MQLGLIGLGKMGGNMAERLRLGGHQVVGFDFNKDTVAKLTASGNVGVSTLEDLAKNLKGRKAIWIMVPQGKPVDDTIAKLEPMLNPGDILIDGGNSNYKDTMKRHDVIEAKHFHFVDVGTSGGVWGLKEGYSMMIGGDKEPVEYLRPIFGTLCEDDSQRDRIRNDAGLRGRLYDHGDQEGTRPRPAADIADMALWERGAELAAGPDGRCAE